jgi:tight adherence protein B
MVILVATFLSSLVIVVGMYWLFIEHPEARDRRTIQRRLASTSTLVRATILRTDDVLSTVGPLARLLRRGQTAVQPVRELLDRSGLRFTPGAVLLASLLCAAGTGAMLSMTGAPVIAALGFSALSASVPLLYVRRAARRRLNAFEAQFANTIDVLARSLRAGHAFTTALEMVGAEAPEPIGTEFRRIFEYQNFGMSLDEALKQFAARIPLIDARFFVTAVLTQREVGGNLSELLEGLATVIRERLTIKREMRIASAHGRMTGWVLGLLPPVLAGVMFLIAPEHMGLLLFDPLGVQMLYAALFLQALGVVSIRRIVNIEY